MTENRKSLIQAIQQYQAIYPEESVMPKRIEALLHNAPDCFCRTRKEGHLTGSAWVINKEATHVLLTHHKKLNMWLQLGGHADGDDDIQRVALREATEESGITDLRIVDPVILDVDIHTIPARKDEVEHEHFDIRYLIQCTGNESFKVSKESNDLKWIEIDKLSRLTKEESMLRMAKKCHLRMSLPH